MRVSTRRSRPKPLCRSRRRREGRPRQHGEAEGVAARARSRRTATPGCGEKAAHQISEEVGRKISGTGGLAGGPAKRRTPDLSLKPASRRRGPFDHRSRLGRGVVNLHLKHLVLILQRHARLFGGFDRVVVRLEVTVHHQRVAFGRRLVGANDFARLLFFRFDLRLFFMPGSQIMIRFRIRISSLCLSMIFRKTGSHP